MLTLNKHILILASFAFFVFVNLSSFAHAVNINSCTNITSPGYYNLTQNILNSPAIRCINISSSDVILEGNNFLIDGIDALNTYGVYAASASRLKNITVKNLKVSGWGYGIYFLFVNYSSIQNNNPSKSRTGIYLEISHFNTITGNTAIGYDNSSSDTGIRLRLSHNNTLSNNVANSNWGFGILLTGSSNNTITGNTANNQGQGIELQSGANSNVLINNSLFINRYGINIEGGTRNDVINNSVIFHRYGIRMSATNSTIKDNVIQRNGEYNPPFWEIGAGLWIGAANNKIFNNIFDNYNLFYDQDVNFEFSFPPSPPSNTWNTTKQVATNILGRERIGGNYWGGLEGPSPGCTDNDKDSICDSNYTLSSNNIDYLPLAACRYETHNITSCTRIICPGTYKLTNNIINSAAERCIEILTKDVYRPVYRGGRRGVTIDGQGYQLDGLDNPNTSGVYIYKESPSVIIKNLTVTDWGNGIYYENVSSGSIENDTAISNYNGISINFSSKINITNNTLSNNFRGINFESSNNSRITKNTPLNNTVGIYLRYSNKTNISENNIFNNNNGIGLNLSRNNTVFNNIFNNTLNAYDDGSNFWNITKTASENILGGPFKGGNLWHDYTGIDLDGDFIGDTGNTTPDGPRYNSNGNIASGGDFLPLIRPAIACRANITSNTIFTNDVFNCVEKGIDIGADDITVDCNGHLIGGLPGSNFGVLINNKRNVTIQNCNIRGFSFGMVVNNSFGGKIANNIMENNFIGLLCTGCSQNKFINSNIRSNTLYGMRLESSSNNQINNSVFANNGLALSFADPESYFNIIENTTANGDSYLHLLNENGRTVSGLVSTASKISNLGKISVINSTGVTLTNMILSNNDEDGSGIFLYKTNSSNVSTSTTTDNVYGIRLELSHENSISLTSSENTYGVFLNHSSGNNVKDSNTLNNFYGFYLNSSLRNRLSNILANASNTGILFSSSNENNVTMAEVKNSFVGLLFNDLSSNNLISSLTASNNQIAIRFNQSSNNIISDSFVTDSTLYDFFSSNNSLNNANNLRIEANRMSFESFDIFIRKLLVPSPEDPKGLLFNINRSLDISNNSLNSWIFLSMSYVDTDLGIYGPRENSLGLHRFDIFDDEWVLASGSTADVNSNTVSANITSFSTFSILGTIRPTRIAYKGVPCVTGDSFHQSISDASNSANNNDQIVVCSGSFNENSITVNDALDIKSYDGSSETVVNAISGDIFQISASNVNITGLNLRNANNTGAAAIRLSGSNNNISNNIIEANYDGVVISTSNNSIINNTIMRSLRSGTLLTSTSRDNRIELNTFLNNSEGVLSTSTSRNLITFNIFNESQTAIDLMNTTNTTIDNNLLSSSNIGIELRVSTSFNNISNNILTANTIGIRLSSNNNNNNTLENNIISGSTEYGIWHGYSNNNTIKNNDITNNNLNGIHLFSSNNNTIVENHISNNSVGGVNLSSSDGNNISDNQVSLNGIRGIHLFFSDFNTISRNLVFGSVSGIRLTFSTKNNVTNNVASLNQHGIYLDDSDFNSIEENMATGNLESGITAVYGSSQNAISNNTANRNGLIGIFLSINSNNNNISSNSAAQHPNFGIEINSSSYNTISDNFAGNNTLNGILIANSSNSNTIKGNTIQENKKQGLSINGSSDNLIFKNNFLFNSNTTFCDIDRICQAFDNGINYWNASDGGNLWSDYDSPEEGCNDVDANGFCDNPYTKITDGVDYLPSTSFIGEFKIEAQVDVVDNSTRLITVQIVDPFGNPLRISGKQITFSDITNTSSPLFAGTFSDVFVATNAEGVASTIYVMNSQLIALNGIALIQVESEGIRAEINIPAFREFPSIFEIDQKYRKYFIDQFDFANELNLSVDWGILLLTQKIVFDQLGINTVEIPREQIVPLISITEPDGTKHPRASNDMQTFEMGDLLPNDVPMTITAVGDLGSRSITDTYWVILEKHKALEGLGGLRELKLVDKGPGWLPDNDSAVYRSTLELGTTSINLRIIDRILAATGLVEIPEDKIDDVLKAIRDVLKDPIYDTWDATANAIAESIAFILLFSETEKQDLLNKLTEDDFVVMKQIDWLVNNEIFQYPQTFLDKIPSFNLPNWIPYVGGDYGVDLNSLKFIDIVEFKTLDGSAFTQTGGMVNIKLGRKITSNTKKVEVDYFEGGKIFKFSIKDVPGEKTAGATMSIFATNFYEPEGSRLRLARNRWDFGVSGTVPVQEWNFGIAQVGIAIEFNGQLFIVFVHEGEKVKFDVGGVDIEVTALGYGKIDIAIASASFEAGAGVGVGAQVSRARGFEITSLRGLIVVRLDWELLFYSDHWGKKWICDIWPAIQGGDVSCTTADASEPTGWHVMKRDYVNENYAEFVANRASDSISPQNALSSLATETFIPTDTNLLPSTTETALIQNIFPESDPQLALNRNNDNLMLVYVHDDISKNISQAFEIFYIRHNDTAWSEPKPITNNTQADVRPDVIFDSFGNAFAIWASVNNTTVTDETPLNETIKYIEITYSTFSLSTNQWTEPRSITNNNFFDYDPILAAGSDGKVMAMWIADLDNIITIGSQANQSGQSYDLNKTIYYSLWDGSSWSSPAIVANNIPLQNRVEFDFIGDQAIAVWGQDMDANSSTDNDREIVYSMWDGVNWILPVQVTNNSLEDRLPTVIYDDGRKLLAWEGIERKEVNASTFNATTNETINVTVNVTEYRIYYSTFNGVWSEPTLITDTRQVEQLILTENPQENPVLLWQTISDEGTDVFYSVFDETHNSWGAEKQLTNDSSGDFDYSPVINSTNHIINSFVKSEAMLINETVTVSNETFNVTVTKAGNASIFLLTHHIFTDLEITDEDIVLSGFNVTPGETITINATVHNVGDLSVDNIRVRFSDGYPGTEIGTQIIDTISSGRNKTVSVNWRIPQINQSHDIYVEIDPLNDIVEENETNNKAFIRIVLPDLSVDFAKANYISDNEVLIDSLIENIGSIPASNISVSFYFSDTPFFDNKTLIETRFINVLDPGSKENINITWNISNLSANNYFVFVVVDPDDLIPEGLEINNVGLTFVSVSSDLAIKDIIVTDVIEGNASFSVTISNLASFAAENVSLQVFKNNPFFLNDTPDFSRTNTFNTTAPRTEINESLLIINDTIPFIGAKENITINAAFADPSGDYDVHAIVDPQDLIQETDEFNNVKSVPVRILQRLNLISLNVADIDSDTLFDYITAEVEANISKKGSYYLTGTLNNQINITGSNLVSLDVGTQRILLNFSGIEIREKGIDGPYTLKDVRLHDENGVMAKLIGEFATQPFTHTSFQPLPIALTGNFSDSGMDINGDGLFEFLEIIVNFNVTKAGNYIIHGSLYNSFGNNTGSVYNSTFLEAGNQTVLLRFDGATIREKGVDGPYNLAALIIYSGNQDELIRVLDVYTTRFYSYTDFQRRGEIIISSPAELIGRSAWPDFHHQDLRKNSIQTLFAKVKNVGNETTFVYVLFDMLDVNGSAFNATTNVTQLQPDETMVLNTTFVPPQVSNTYFVTAKLFFKGIPLQINDPNWIQDGTKKFKFSTVTQLIKS